MALPAPAAPAAGKGAGNRPKQKKAKKAISLWWERERFFLGCVFLIFMLQGWLLFTFSSQIRLFYIVLLLLYVVQFLSLFFIKNIFYVRNKFRQIFFRVCRWIYLLN